MSDKFRDSAGFKVLAVIPVPGVDVAAGLAVYACEQGVKAAGESLAGFIKSTVAEAASDAVTAAGQEMKRQTQPVLNTLDKLSDGVSELAESVKKLS